MAEHGAPVPEAANSSRDLSLGILATAAVLALLYLGRDVLVPITLATILSLLMAPLVRQLRRLWLGQTASVIAAVLALAIGCGAVASVIGVQVVRLASSLPVYERTIRTKLEILDTLTVGRINTFTGQAGRLLPKNLEPRVGGAAAVLPASADGSAVPVAVELRQPPADPLHVLHTVFSSLWTPLQTAGIVLVVLVFMLLEHEALRDRFIRIAGGNDIRATTIALNDAGERLSRFFVSQFAVNFGVGLVLWLALRLLGLPHALLWGVLAAVLRFVPYVGVWIAAALSALMAAAVEPGWGLALATLGSFVAVEVITGQLVEPQLYGHTTGLSPLSVVVSAIFWSWLWGPVGLILSTPLTLCLLVAGRHIKALSLLDVLLGDTQALTLPQRFYQRILAGDSDEIIAAARAYLKRNSFAAYCDLVLLPAMHLARLDVATGAISDEQLRKVRATVVAVIAGIGGVHGGAWRRRSDSVLAATNIGRELRRERERRLGRSPAEGAAAANSVMLCVGLGSAPDDLATELLVRILREQRLDARHVAIDELAQSPSSVAAAEQVSTVFVVSAFPSEERARGAALVKDLRERFSGARIVSVFLPGMLLQPGQVADAACGADKTARSFGEAAQIALDAAPAVAA